MNAKHESWSKLLSACSCPLTVLLWIRHALKDMREKEAIPVLSIVCEDTQIDIVGVFIETLINRIAINRTADTRIVGVYCASERVIRSPASEVKGKSVSFIKGVEGHYTIDDIYTTRKAVRYNKAPITASSIIMTMPSTAKLPVVSGVTMHTLYRFVKISSEFIEDLSNYGISKFIDELVGEVRSLETSLQLLKEAFRKGDYIPMRRLLTQECLVQASELACNEGVRTVARLVERLLVDVSRGGREAIRSRARSTVSEAIRKIPMDPLERQRLIGYGSWYLSDFYSSTIYQGKSFSYYFPEGFEELFLGKAELEQPKVIDLMEDDWL